MNSFLQNVVWDCDYPDNGMINLKLGVKDANGNDIRYLRRAEQPAVTYELNTLVTLAESLLDIQGERSSLMDKLAQRFPAPTQLASLLTDHSFPLYRPAPHSNGPRLVTETVYLGGDASERHNSQYVDKLGSVLRQIRVGVQSDSLEIREMTDPYRLVMYRSDHFLTGPDFATWTECRNAYLNLIEQGQDIILHVFPEEQNALYYEKLISHFLGVRCLLPPRIVTLLHDQETFELFFRAFNIGFINRDAESGQAFWYYQGTSDSDPIYLTIPSQTLERLGDTPNIVQVIHNFIVSGRDQRPTHMGFRPLQWGKILRDVQLKETEYGATAMLRLLEHNLQDEDGILNLIRRSYREYAVFSEPQRFQEVIKSEEDALALLVTTIYRKLITGLDNHMW
jgi:hypothetical protein